jgi:hypothetical protein
MFANPLRRMPLPARLVPVGGENGINEAGEPVPLRPSHWLRAPASRRRRGARASCQPFIGRCQSGGSLPVRSTLPRPQPAGRRGIPARHPSPASRRLQRGHRRRCFAPPQPDCPVTTCGAFFHCRLRARSAQTVAGMRLQTALGRGEGPQGLPGRRRTSGRTSHSTCCCGLPVIDSVRFTG